MDEVTAVCKNIILCLFWFQICVVAIECKDRQQRLLHFPDKTNVVMTMSLLKLLPSESIVNTLTEYDVLFPVPLHPYKRHSRSKREVERNLIYGKLKTAFDTLRWRGELQWETFINGIRKTIAENSNSRDNVLRDIAIIFFK